MRHYFMMHSIPFTDDSILQLHKRKRCFQELIQSGRIQAAREYGSSCSRLLTLALNWRWRPPAMRKRLALPKTLLGTELYARFGAILAGDIVRGKPTRNLSSC